MNPKEFKIEIWPIANLIPYETNVKKHPPEQVAKIAESIRKFGFDQPIVVDKHGVIIKGHGRRLGSIEAGRTHVPVVVRVDLTTEQVKASRLADNRAAISDLDMDMLRAEMATFDRDLVEGIFDSKELDFVAADLGTINSGAFVEDMGKVVGDQKADVEQRLANVKGGRVQLVKAFGFKDIAASGQIVISSLMARAEAITGLSGEAAFLKWADTQLQLS